MLSFSLSNRFLNKSHGSVDYAKKKEKRAQIKFVRDETVQKDDQYKSHTVHVPSGEPPNSRSRPPAKRKPGIIRPVTQGKLLKSGGPSKVRSVVDGRFVTHPSCHCSLRDPGRDQQRSRFQEVLSRLLS